MLPLSASDGRIQNTASRSFETFANLLFRISVSERVSNWTGHVILANEASLRHTKLETPILFRNSNISPVGGVDLKVNP